MSTIEDGNDGSRVPRVFLGWLGSGLRRGRLHTSVQLVRYGECIRQFKWQTFPCHDHHRRVATRNDDEEDR